MPTTDRDRPAGAADVAPDFEQDGYCLLRGVVDPERVELLRSVADRAMSGADELLPQELLALPEFAEVLVQEEVLAALRTVFGEPFTYYPNFTVRRDVYVPWHIDDAFVGPGREYVWEPGFAHLQGAVYLQDNDPEGTGGAIDVVPGSQRVPTDGQGRTRPDYAPLVGDAATVPALAGDLLLWDARTVHRSTGEPRESAHEDPKYGLFFSAARRDHYENNRFLVHLAGKRVLRGSSGTHTFDRHLANAELRYPDDFPAAWRERLEQGGGRVTTLLPWPPD